MANHLMFYEFRPSYTEWVHHGELFSTQSTSVPQNVSYNDASVEASFEGNANTIGSLNGIFGIRNEGNSENNAANNMWDIEDPMLGVDDQFVDEFMCNNGMNEGENDEDVGYRRLMAMTIVPMRCSMKMMKTVIL